MFPTTAFKNFAAMRLTRNCHFFFFFIENGHSSKRIECNQSSLRNFLQILWDKCFYRTSELSETFLLSFALRKQKQKSD